MWLWIGDKTLWVSDVGAVLRNLRKSRGLNQLQLEEATVEVGHRVSKSQIGKVERGDRTLSDDVYAALSQALHLGDDEKARIEAARAGEVVDVADQLTLIEQRLLLELTLLRGEMRGHADEIMRAIDRIRDLMRP